MAAFLLLLFFAFPSLAQNEWCGTMHNVQRKIQTNPLLQAEYQNMLDRFQTLK